ncbi:LysR substrate-binding domain-containing protein [Aeromonas jandaei]
MKNLPKLQQIKIFNEVIRCGSIRAAAKEINLSQPALTRALKELEHQMGATLLVRSNEGVTLTEAGKAFSIRTSLIVDELQRAVWEIKKINENAYNSVTFGISALFGDTILCSVIHDFKTQHPETLINIKEAQLSTLLPCLRDGRLEFALGTVTERMPLGDFIIEPLFEAPFCIVARKGHPLLECKSLQELSHAKWLFPETDMGYYHYIRQYIPFNHPDNPFAPVMTDSMVCIINLVLNCDYITILAKARLNESRFCEVLTPLPLTDTLLPNGNYALIYPRKRPLTQAALLLLEGFKRCCLQHDWAAA